MKKESSAHPETELDHTTPLPGRSKEGGQEASRAAHSSPPAAHPYLQTHPHLVPLQRLGRDRGSEKPPLPGQVPTLSL